MATEILAAIIGAVGGIAVACVPLLGTNRSLKHRVEELEAADRIERQNTQLASANTHWQETYVPVQRSLSDLENAHKGFKRREMESHGDPGDPEHEALRAACSAYLDTLSDLREKGKDAFLIAELDEGLRSFERFLDASLESSKPHTRMVFRFRLWVPWISPPFEHAQEFEFPGNHTGRPRACLQIQSGRMLPSLSARWLPATRQRRPSMSHR